MALGLILLGAIHDPHAATTEIVDDSKVTGLISAGQMTVRQWPIYSGVAPWHTHLPVRFRTAVRHDGEQSRLTTSDWKDEMYFRNRHFIEDTGRYVMDLNKHDPRRWRAWWQRVGLAPPSIDGADDVASGEARLDHFWCIALYPIDRLGRLTV